MKRLVKIATVQPPGPTKDSSAERIAGAGIELFDAAAAGQPDIVCFPEYLNCMADPLENRSELFQAQAETLLQQTAERARQNRCYVILPLLVEEGGRRYNRAFLLDRNGRQIGSFDKVHLTRVERDQLGITGGGDWPVFELDFGRIGIMICYDGCFPEPSRILALRGAEAIFWPSLQRSFTRDQLELQTRAHAYFNYVTVVRSSYGRRAAKGQNVPGMVGFSCICTAEGTILSALDGEAGWLDATVDLDEPRGPRSFDGQQGPLRTMRLADRRPDRYHLLTEPLAVPPSSSNLASSTAEKPSPTPKQARMDK